VTFAFDDQRSAMGADIGKTAQLGGFVRHQYQRLVETSIEERERQDVARRLHPICVARPLPVTVGGLEGGTEELGGGAEQILIGIGESQRDGLQEGLTLRRQAICRADFSVCQVGERLDAD